MENENQISSDSWSDVALVVAHPAHAIMVAGMVQRYKPNILILGKSAAQESIVRHALALIGMEGKATFLEFADSESYARLLAGDFDFHVALGKQISNWLLSICPRVVIGDAFELSNFQHDLGRALLDNALRSHRLKFKHVQNYEFPICCRSEEGTGKLCFQRFPFGEYETFRLTASEVTNKRTLGLLASQHDDFIASVCPMIPDIQIEPYRSVPWDRDYTTPPPGLKKHYDDRGREEVSAGRYAKPILFDEHFVPLVRALGL
jgi:hypothetical protein